MLSSAEIRLHPQHPDVLETSDIAYRNVAALGYAGLRLPGRVENVHTWQVCESVSKFIGKGLIDRGRDISLLRRHLTGFGHPGHMYVRDHTDSSEVILIEGAWQQFLGIWRPKRDLPRVVVGTPEEVVDLVGRAGVSKKNLDYWRRERTLSVHTEAVCTYSPEIDEWLEAWT